MAIVSAPESRSHKVLRATRIVLCLHSPITRLNSTTKLGLLENSTDLALGGCATQSGSAEFSRNPIFVVKIDRLQWESVGRFCYTSGEPNPPSLFFKYADMHMRSASGFWHAPSVSWRSAMCTPSPRSGCRAKPGWGLRAQAISGLSASPSETPATGSYWHKEFAGALCGRGESG